jgi:hypothetical protein
MTYLLFMSVCYLLAWFCTKNNLDLPDDSLLQIIAILTAGEVISWRCKK